MPTASFPTPAAAARRSCRSPKVTKQQAIAEAKGQSARFLKVYDEYKKAPDVTRQRIYLETMERVLGGSEKLVYDGGSSGQNIVPYLPLSELTPRRPPAAPATGQPQQGGTR
jgi:Membrane protease subunits, stomatin/prohibitin homologs